MISTLSSFLALAALTAAGPTIPRAVTSLNEAATAEAQQKDNGATRAFSNVQIKTSDGRCLSVDKLSGDFRANLTPIQIAACGSKDGQGWDVITKGKHIDVANAMLIVSTLTNACLNFDPRRAAGNQVLLFSCGGRADGGGAVTNSQTFPFDGSAGPLALAPQNAQGSCLTAKGNVLDVANCNTGDANQSFTFGNAAAGPPAGNAPATGDNAQETQSTPVTTAKPAASDSASASSDCGAPQVVTVTVSGGRRKGKARIAARSRKGEKAAETTAQAATASEEPEAAEDDQAEDDQGAAAPPASTPAKATSPAAAAETPSAAAPEKPGKNAGKNNAKPTSVANGAAVASPEPSKAESATSAAAEGGSGAGKGKGKGNGKGTTTVEAATSAGPSATKAASVDTSATNSAAVSDATLTASKASSLLSSNTTLPTSTSPASQPSSATAPANTLPTSGPVSPIANPTAPVPVSRAGGTLQPSAAAQSQQRDAGATRAFSSVEIRAPNGQCLFVDPTAGDFRQNLIPVALVDCSGTANEKWDVITSGKHNNGKEEALIVSSLMNGCLSFDGRRAGGDTVTMFSCGGRADGEGETNAGQLTRFIGATSFAIAPSSENGKTCVIPGNGRLESGPCPTDGSQLFSIFP